MTNNKTNNKSFLSSKITSNLFSNWGKASTSKQKALTIPQNNLQTNLLQQQKKQKCKTLNKLSKIN